MGIPRGINKVFQGKEPLRTNRRRCETSGWFRNSKRSVIRVWALGRTYEKS